MSLFPRVCFGAPATELRKTLFQNTPLPYGPQLKSPRCSSSECTWCLGPQPQSPLEALSPDPALPHGRACPCQVCTPQLKGHGGDSGPVSHTGPPRTTRPAPRAAPRGQAATLARPKGGWPGARADVAAAGRSTCPAPWLPARGQSPLRRRGTGHLASEPGRQGLRAPPAQLWTPARLRARLSATPARTHHCG